MDRLTSVERIAYNQGAEARYAGERYDSNPYAAYLNAVAWAEGWVEADIEIRDKEGK